MRGPTFYRFGVALFSSELNRSCSENRSCCEQPNTWSHCWRGTLHDQECLSRGEFTRLSFDL